MGLWRAIPLCLLAAWTTLASDAAASPVGTIVAGGTESAGGGTRLVTYRLSADPEPVLIELDEVPLLRRPSILAEGGLRRSSAAATAARSRLLSEQTRIEAEILAIVEGRRRRSLLPTEVVSRRYSTVFNGFAAVLSREEQQEVRSIAGVTAVHPDREVRASLDVSGPVVGSTLFHTGFGFDGAGVRIAIIDTGIDYTHPDLGGCFGAGCRVEGGWDFVNGDPDPLDDNGHGTHVAGIAASSNPVLEGIAPGASLLAYKVLDRFANGLTSSVIAAIERAVDPDADGDTSDRADVINLSLGGFGDADDPTSQAVDSATAAGVVVVVAAGNRGDFFAIDSPGTARSAITVGATNDVDGLAAFSSRGPTPGFAIKPDIAAPGVAVCASQGTGTSLGPACLDGEHINLQGTSMATPHVAGAAALLRGVFPSFTPSEIKSLLVNNAADVGHGVMEAGGGRLALLASGAAETVLEPATLSLGIDDQTTPIWISNTSLTVTNRGATSRFYTLTPAPLPTGIQVVPTPSQFALVAGGSTVVNVETIVDNALLPDVGPAPNTYEGALLVDSGSETQRVPFAFLKAIPLHLSFNEIPFCVLAHDRTAFSLTRCGFGSKTLDLFVPGGTYDVVTTFITDSKKDPWIVVREGVDATSELDLSISRLEAVHRITHEVRDEQGKEVATPLIAHHLTHAASGFQSILGMQGAIFVNALKISNVSSAYEVRHAFVGSDAAHGEDDYLLFTGIDGGVSSDRDLGNSPFDMTPLDSRYHPLPGEENVWGSTFLFFGQAEAASLLAFRILRRSPCCIDRRLFTVPLALSNHDMSVEIEVIKPPFSVAGVPARSHPLRPGVQSGTVEVLLDSDVRDVVFTNTLGQVPLNLGPFFWALAMENSPGGIAVRDPRPSNIPNPVAFYTQGAGYPLAQSGQVDWELDVGGIVIDSGSFNQGDTDGTQYTSSQPPGSYRLVSVGPPYALDGPSGSTRVELTFDTSVPPTGPYDPNPPFVTSLLISDGGILTSRIGASHRAQVSVEISDEALSGQSTGIDSVSFTYTTAAGDVALPAFETGPGRYSTEIVCDTTLVDLTITATDVAGNAMRQDFEPAFSCSMCGNGALESGEACDDGDTDDGDGCSASCEVESGYSCTGEPSTCIQIWLVSGKLISVRDKLGDPTKRKIIVVSKDRTLETPVFRGPGDPVAFGGSELRIFNPTTGADDVTFPLPRRNWRRIIGGYRYRDPRFEDGPCRLVLIKRGKVLRAACLARPGVDLPFTLDDGPQGTLAVTLKLAQERPYCMSFGGTLLRDTDIFKSPTGVGRFRRRNAAAPVSCPP